MRIYRAVIAVALLAAALPSYACAQVESTPIPAPKKPNFSSMSYLVGTWTCTTKSSRRPAAYVTTSTYTMDPSGWWMNETSTTNPTKWIAVRLTNTDKITFDPDTHRWVDITDGPQNGYGLAFSSGWNGDQMSWHDVSFAPTADIKSQTDNTVTKVSNTKMTSSSSFTEAGTGRVVSVSGVCTKH
ncbi:MAG: hypothetical protein WB810_10870 [Candidatus Cybelea sp.]